MHTVENTQWMNSNTHTHTLKCTHALSCLCKSVFSHLSLSQRCRSLLFQGLLIHICAVATELAIHLTFALLSPYVCLIWVLCVHRVTSLNGVCLFLHSLCSPSPSWSELHCLQSWRMVPFLTRHPVKGNKMGSGGSLWSTMSIRDLRLYSVAYCTAREMPNNNKNKHTHKARFL